MGRGCGDRAGMRAAAYFEASGGWALRAAGLGRSSTRGMRASRWTAGGAASGFGSAAAGVRTPGPCSGTPAPRFRDPAPRFRDPGPGFRNPGPRFRAPASHLFASGLLLFSSAPMKNHSTSHLVAWMPMKITSEPDLSGAASELGSAAPGFRKATPGVGDAAPSEMSCPRLGRRRDLQRGKTFRLYRSSRYEIFAT